MLLIQTSVSDAAIRRAGILAVLWALYGAASALLGQFLSTTASAVQWNGVVCGGLVCSPHGTMEVR
jgi:hypothetical protein